MRKGLIVTALAASLSTGVAASAFAECRDQSTATDPAGIEKSTSEASRDATEIVREMVEEAEAKEPDEPAYAETGPAKPRENWFGCSPGSDAEHCEESEAAQSNDEGAETQVTAKAEDLEENSTSSDERAHDDAECGKEKAS